MNTRADTLPSPVQESRSSSDPGGDDDAFGSGFHWRQNRAVRGHDFERLSERLPCGVLCAGSLELTIIRRDSDSIIGSDRNPSVPLRRVIRSSSSRCLLGKLPGEAVWRGEIDFEDLIYRHEISRAPASISSSPASGSFLHRRGARVSSLPNQQKFVKGLLHTS